MQSLGDAVQRAFNARVRSYSRHVASKLWLSFDVVQPIVARNFAKVFDATGYGPGHADRIRQRLLEVVVTEINRQQDVETRVKRALDKWR